MRAGAPHTRQARATGHKLRHAGREVNTSNDPLGREPASVTWLLDVVNVALVGRKPGANDGVVRIAIGWSNGDPHAQGISRAERPSLLQGDGARGMGAVLDRGDNAVRIADTSNGPVGCRIANGVRHDLTHPASRGPGDLWSEAGPKGDCHGTIAGREFA